MIPIIEILVFTMIIINTKFIRYQNEQSNERLNEFEFLIQIGLLIYK